MDVGKVQIAEDFDAPLPDDGDAVVVRLRPVRKPGDGIQRSAGAWAGDGEDLDHFLAEVRRSRQGSSRGGSGARHELASPA